MAPLPSPNSLGSTTLSTPAPSTGDQSGPQGIALTDNAGNITWANAPFTRLLGLEGQNLAGRDFIGILPPEANEIASAMRARAPQRRRVFLPRSGIWLDVDLQLAPNGDGTRNMICLVQDVSADTAYRLELEATNKRLSLAMESAHIGLWDWDVNGDQFWTNPQWWRYLGFDQPQVVLGDELADLVLHPEDVPRVRENRATFFAENKDQLYNEMRHRDATGEWRWISSTGRVTDRDPDGRPVRVSGVYVDIHDRKMASERIAFVAHHDTLTGLPNRAEIKANLNDALAGWKLTGDPFWVFALDLHRFKAINDTYGHTVGDAMLQAVSKRIKSAVREGDVVARLGGDEFSILVRGGGENGALAEVIAARLVETLSLPYSISGTMVQLGASIGIAKAPDHGKDADTLMRNAEAVLYKVKAEGKAGFRFFDEVFDAESRHRRALESELSGAIQRGELEPHYQTITDLATRRVTGIEALLRWRHRDLGLVLPDHFIPIAEATGLIVPIGEWVIRRACFDAMTWPDDISVSVNVSTAQLGSFGLAKVVADALKRSGLPARRLAIEVTESIFLGDDAAMLAELNKLQASGVKLVLDDFGTGYASLGYLRRLRFDRIKIDKSFIADAGRDPHATAVARAIANLADSLGMECIAEGIETEMQAELMKTAGCQFGQGHLFSRPEPRNKLNFG